MKLAISATGKDLDSMIDPSFGRANYFVIIDAESGDIVKVINNSAAQDAAGGAGINAATIVTGSGAQTVLTGQVGPNALGVLRAGGIKVISNVSGRTVGEAVEQYRKGTISSSDEGPGAAVHPGQTPGPSVGGRGIAGGGRGMGGGGGRGLGGGSGMGRGLGKKSKR